MEENKNPEENGDELTDLGMDSDFGSLDDMDLAPIEAEGLDEPVLGGPSDQNDLVSDDLDMPVDELDIDLAGETADADDLDMDLGDEPAALDELDIDLGDESVNADDLAMDLGDESAAIDELDIDLNDDSISDDDLDMDLGAPVSDMSAEPSSGDDFNDEAQTALSDEPLDMDLGDDLGHDDEVSLSEDPLDVDSGLDGNLDEDISLSDSPLDIDLDAPEVETTPVELSNEDDISEKEISGIPEDDLEDIALSSDELDNIINSNDGEFFDEMSEQDLQTPEGIDPDDMAVNLDKNSASGLANDLEPINPAFTGEEDLSQDLHDDGAIDEMAPKEMADEEDEIIALSSDELDNILEDVNMSEEAGEAPVETAAGEMSLGDDMELSIDDDLPELELEDGPMLPDGEDSDLATSDVVQSGVGDDFDDDEITLSDDELSQVILDTTDETIDAAMDGVEEDLPENPVLTSLEMDDDEPIALTAEELGNIVSEVDMEDTEGVSKEAEMDHEDPQTREIPQHDTAIIEDSAEDEEIALSVDELDHILEDVDDTPVVAEGLPPESEPVYDEAIPEESAITDETISLDAVDKNVINLDEYAETPPSPEALKEPEVAEEKELAVTSASTAVADTVAVAEGINKVEMRKMISYLDGLFDQLPEETIREFSRSEYFDLYKKIMTDLEL